MVGFDMPTSNGESSELADTTSSSTLSDRKCLKISSHLEIGVVVVEDELKVALRNLRLFAVDEVDAVNNVPDGCVSTLRMT
jgi:hypothetical protein